MVIIHAEKKGEGIHKLPERAVQHVEHAEAPREGEDGSRCHDVAGNLAGRFVGSHAHRHGRGDERDAHEDCEWEGNLHRAYDGRVGSAHSLEEGGGQDGTDDAEEDVLHVQVPAYIHVDTRDVGPHDAHGHDAQEEGEEVRSRAELASSAADIPLPLHGVSPLLYSFIDGHCRESDDKRKGGESRRHGDDVAHEE